MKVTLNHSNFIVVDEFLPKEDFNHLVNFFLEENFRPVHSDKWIKAFRLSDGTPHWGDVYLSHKVAEDKQSAVYPTGRGIDVFIQKLISAENIYKDLIGENRKKWSHFFCRPYLYSNGKGLSWHTDGRGDVEGAYVYYAHKKWHAQWGAELLIDDSNNFELDYPLVKMYDGTEKKLGLHMDDAIVNEAVMSKGIGYYLEAKPNRLVLLKKGILHKICRVDPNAGDYIRASITGFFLNREIKKGAYK
ncbi:MAG: 2OG-Fe(II) oxygenase [Bdellovibrionales bacterium]|nr:2OG-Fe(II) oxygenase [Bdellovibrionales bacterium]